MQAQGVTNRAHAAAAIGRLRDTTAPFGHNCTLLSLTLPNGLSLTLPNGRQSAGDDEPAARGFCARYDRRHGMALATFASVRMHAILVLTIDSGA
jgi:hypothetical protein